jgi:nucleotide-binding universal stress UspA family protein
MYKILVPTDGSANALVGVRYALRLAGERPGTLICLANVQPRFHRHIAQFASARAIDGFCEERVRAALGEAERLVAAAGLPYRAFALRGEPAAALAALAAREAIDGMVLGTARKSAWLRVMTGSITSRIIAGSPVPVSVIAGEAPSRLVRWAVPAAGAGLAALLLAAE